MSKIAQPNLKWKNGKVKLSVNSIKYRYINNDNVFMKKPKTRTLTNYINNKVRFIVITLQEIVFLLTPKRITVDKGEQSVL